MTVTHRLTAEVIKANFRGINSTLLIVYKKKLRPQFSLPKENIALKKNSQFAYNVLAS